MNRVGGFIIIITGALVRISEYRIILDIPIKSWYTAVQYRGTQPKYRGTTFSAVPNTSTYVLQSETCSASHDSMSRRLFTSALSTPRHEYDLQSTAATFDTTTSNEPFERTRYATAADMVYDYWPASGGGSGSGGRRKWITATMFPYPPQCRRAPLSGRDARDATSSRRHIADTTHRRLHWLTVCTALTGVCPSAMLIPASHTVAQARRRRRRRTS